VENCRPTRVCNIVVAAAVVVTIVVGHTHIFFFPKILPAISVAAFTSARQITGQPVAIKITARQLSPQIVRNSKNVASTRATTQNNKQTRVVVCCPVLCREFMAQNT